MRIHEQPAEVLGLFHALQGAGARHAAAGLVRDVLLSESAAPTTPGRMFLVRALGGAAFDRLVDAPASADVPSVEELVPEIREPHDGLSRSA